MEPYDADVFFSGALLGLDKSGCAVEADDETACDFGIEGSAMSCFLNSADSQFLF